jgi:hypothetical protein
MTTSTVRLSFALLGLALALPLPALAHDPKLHEKEAAEAKAGPDCAKLATMDMSKMDPNDPVMMAMHAKCEKSKKAAAAKEHADGHDHAMEDKHADGDGGH